MTSFDAKWRAFAAIALTYVTIVFSSTMAFLVLTSISDEFNVTLGAVAWVVIIESLIVAALLLPLGNLGDRLGRRRVLTWGMAIFGLGCVLTAIAPSFGLVIAARVVASIGNALVQSIATGLLIASFPTAERGLAMGAQTTAVALGSASGPILSGLLLDVVSWRLMFALLAIPSTISVVLIVALIARDAERHQARRIDFGSALLSAAAITVITITINNPFDWSWRSWPVALAAAAAAALGVAYVRWELASTDPMLDLRLFRIGTFRTSVLVRWLGFTAGTTLSLLLPIILISVYRLSGGLAGVVIACVALGMGVSAQISGRLYDRMGPALPTLSGLGLQTTVFASLTFVSLDTDWTLLALAALCQGLAMGMWNVPSNSAMLGATPPESLGVGGAFTNVTRTIGNVFGQAIATTVVVAVLRSQNFDIPLGEIENTPGADLSFIDGWRAAFGFAAGLTAAVALVAARLGWPETAHGAAR